MEVGLYIATICVFAVILTLTQLRYYKLKRHARKLAKKLADLRLAQEEITGEIARIANDPVSPDMIDGLSGLPGRRVFEDRLQQIISQSGRQKALFAVMSVDIDNFREIDNLGPDIGDKTLKEIAHRMQMSLRQVDTVSRFAGGCFLFLLPHLSRAETAIYVAQRIQDNLLQTFKVDGHEISVTVSAGIAIYPVDGADAATLLKNADAAMRQAKSAGKNKYQFNQRELHHLGEKELSLAMMVRSPDLINKLIIQYKPYFNSNDNKPVYVQAVPHIRDAKSGMIPFANFANIAESSGKMLEINEWLLRQALQQYQRWYREGFQPKFLAIPVSLRQLENPHFLYKINEVMQELNTNATKLVLDIYDDKLPQNPVFIENLFTDLNHSGIQIAVGVMALGHFAMQKINKIPLTYLKLDAKLIEGASTFKDKEMILNKIIELAKDEQITVIAEGIDNENQKQRLMKLGCEIMEGKVFGYLMPTGSVLELEA